jgi:hypothetical protein
VTFSVTPLKLSAGGSLVIELPLRDPDRDRSAAIEEIIGEVEEGPGFVLAGAPDSDKTSLLKEVAHYFNRAKRGVVALGPLSLREMERSGLNSLGSQLRDWCSENLANFPSSLSSKSQPDQADSIDAWVPFLQKLVNDLKADTLLLLLDDLDSVPSENRETILNDIQNSSWGKITPRLVLGCAVSMPQEERASVPSDPPIAAILLKDTLLDLRRALDESIDGLDSEATSAAVFVNRRTAVELLSSFITSLGSVQESGKRKKLKKSGGEGKGWSQGKGSVVGKGGGWPYGAVAAPPMDGDVMFDDSGLSQKRAGGPDDSRSAKRTRTIEIVEDVDATVYAPAQAPPGDNFLVLVYAHLRKQASAVAKAAKAAAPGVTKRFAQTLDQQVKRGTKLTFNLAMPGLDIDEPSQSIIWRGKYEAVQFSVSIPADAKVRTLVGTVIVSEDSVPIGHLKFTFVIASDGAAATPATQPVPAGTLDRYQQAFISYASPDRAEVLKRVQMLNLRKVRFFQDLLTLEPGDQWEKLIYEYIDQSDVFYLFWSEAASRSPWVEKEILYAIKRKAGNDKGAPEIVPVIIEGPPPAAPPAELSFLHFNDKFMYFISGEERKA